jgi:hypothetical protein
MNCMLLGDCVTWSMENTSQDGRKNISCFHVYMLALNIYSRKSLISSLHLQAYI